MSNRCPVGECTERRGDRHVMCRWHWFTVPRALRDLIEQLNKNDHGSAKHLEAIKDSILAAEQKEAEKLRRQRILHQR